MHAGADPGPQPADRRAAARAAIRRPAIRRAVVATRLGGPEVLELRELPVLDPGRGEVLVAVAAACVNFGDILRRRGQFIGGPTPPFVPGVEAAGTVIARGPGVAGLRVGDPVVAFTNGGAYADVALVAAQTAYPIPPGLAVDRAVAALLAGITASHLVHDLARLRPGETCAVTGAGGGVGGFLVRLAQQRGARVIGVVESPAKRVAAEARGCDGVVLLPGEPLAERLRDLSGGRGVDVVFDSFGSTVATALRGLAPFGRIVLFGESGGFPAGIDLTAHYPANRAILGYGGAGYRARHPRRTRRAVAAVLDLVARDELAVEIEDRFPLERAAEAHARMEAGRTTGRLILVPNA